MTSPEAELRPDATARYGRQMRLTGVGASGQQKLLRARVLVVGMGGLGCPAAQYLAAAGTGTLGLVDFDRVDTSNLHRQILYTEADTGSPKVAAAARRLRAMNPDIEVREHDVELHAGNVRQILQHYDLVLDGSDRLATRYLVNDACVIDRKPLVSAAVQGLEGQAMVYIPGADPCYRCLFPNADERFAPNCASAGVLGAVAGMLGTLQATLALKWLLGLGPAMTGRLLVMSALDLTLDTLQVRRDPACAVCGENASIREPQDPPGFVAREELARAPALSVAQWRAAGTPILLVDVRSGEEYATGSIEGSVNVPLEQIQATADGRLPRLLTERLLSRYPGAALAVDGQTPLLFFCRSGQRSLKACALAQRAGLSAARSLAGGLDALND